MVWFPPELQQNLFSRHKHSLLRFCSCVVFIRSCLGARCWGRYGAWLSSYVERNKLGLLKVIVRNCCSWLASLCSGFMGYSDWCISRRFCLLRLSMGLKFWLRLQISACGTVNRCLPTCWQKSLRIFSSGTWKVECIDVSLANDLWPIS